MRKISSFKMFETVDYHSIYNNIDDILIELKDTGFVCNTTINQGIKEIEVEVSIGDIYQYEDGDEIFEGDETFKVKDVYEYFMMLIDFVELKFPTTKTSFTMYCIDIENKYLDSSEFDSYKKKFTKKAFEKLKGSDMLVGYISAKFNY
jgi:hypothetical protein